MLRTLFAIVLIAAVAGGCRGDASRSSREPLQVLAAASTAEAMRQAAALFEEQSGIPVQVSSGGSNVLAGQILAGAPADLFLAADRQWANAIASKDLAETRQPLLTNELVLIVPRGNPAQIKSPGDLLSSSVRRVALAGESVPAGRYAEQALREAGVYPELVRSQRVARGQDVRVALGYVEAGEADAGLVYQTDAMASAKVEIVHRFPQTAHEPILYELLLLKRAAEKQTAERFWTFLTSQEAQAIFERHGFRSYADSSR